MQPANFIWYELSTTDLPAAEQFYKSVVGWQTEAFGGDGSYIVVKAGEVGVGGLMATPPNAAGMPPAWLGYIYAPNVDATVAAISAAGGVICQPEQDIPGVGRFAVVADPQGAVFMLLQPDGPDQPPLPMETPGAFGWRELSTTDWQAALEFYSSQFGWEKAESMDMGPPVGVYQLFSAGGETVGGMMNRIDPTAPAAWDFYVTVAGSATAAVNRIIAGGGKVLMGPMEVPGGAWVVNCVDPQGAHFSITCAEK